MKICRRVVGLVVFCVSLPLSLWSQTSIVAIITSDSIFIAADAKATTPDKQYSITQCKIRIANGVVWARSNWAYDPAHNFDADAIAEKFMSHHGSVSTRLAGFEHAVVPKLTTIMVNSRETAKPWFDSHVGKEVLDYVFGTFEYGRPKMLRVQFKLRVQGQNIMIEPERHVCPGECPNGMGVAKLGHTKAVEAALKSDPTIWTSLGLETALQHLVQSEIGACPREVGPPVSLAKLDIHGLTWLCKGACNQPNSVPVLNPAMRCDDDE
jgi:hypothetical protein